MAEPGAAETISMLSDTSGSQHVDTDLFSPLLYSTIAGSATALGGCIVLLMPQTPSPRSICATLSFAAGVMLTVSIFDLWLPQALNQPVFATGFMIAGALAYRLLASIPLPEVDALASSMFGSLVMEKRAELPSAASSGHSKDRQAAWRLGALLTIILTLHNAPEGLAVGLQTVKNKSMGLVLCAAIFVHNVAEGIVLAVPLVAGTGSKRFALLVTALSGMSEPLGALVGVLVMRSWLSVVLVPAIEASLCAVAGIMIAVSVLELLPQALRIGSVTTVATSAAAGAAIIAATLVLL